MKDEEGGTGASSDGGARRLANDRFKARSGAWFWGSIALASVLHFLFFSLGPAMTVSGPGTAGWEELEFVNLPEVKLPPPPERIERPEFPIVVELEAPVDFELEPIRFDQFTFKQIAAPSSVSSLSGRPDFREFSPSMVEPRLVNRREVERELLRSYPRTLRAARVSGHVVLWFWIDEQGRVAEHEIKVSSGYASLDKAASSVAEIMEFTPALHRDRAVGIMVALPITFEIR